MGDPQEDEGDGFPPLPSKDRDESMARTDQQHGDRLRMSYTDRNSIS